MWEGVGEVAFRCFFGRMCSLGGGARGVVFWGVEDEGGGGCVVCVESCGVVGGGWGWVGGVVGTVGGDGDGGMEPGLMGGKRGGGVKGLRMGGGEEVRGLKI